MADPTRSVPAHDNPAAARGVEVEIIGDETPAGDAAADVLAEDGETHGLPAQAIRLADGSVKLPLRYPVTIVYRTSADAPVKEERHDVLRFYRLLGTDMRAIGAAGDDSRAVVAMARSARMREGLMHRLYDRMDGADIRAAQEIVGYFLGAGRTTGR